MMDKLGQWSLTPAYDLTYPFDPYQSFYTPHQISINGKTKDINRIDLENIAKKVGVRNYKQIIDLVIDRMATFEQRIHQYGLNNKTIRLLVNEIENNRKRIQR